jgi:O-succinylbenzoic acid--CoA ligase
MRAWIRTRAEATPASLALRTAERSLSFAELAREAEAIARGLRAAGVRRGDRVAALLENGAGFVALVHAAQLAGATIVPLNLRLAPPELAFQLGDADVALLVCGAAVAAERGREAATRLDVRCVSLADLALLAAGADMGAALLSARGGRDDLAAPATHERFELSAPAALLYTSGTSGRPKGALLSHESFLWSAVGSAFHLGTLPSDRWLACMPLFHVGGLSIVLRSVLAGSAVVLHERFDAEAAARALEEDGITLASFVPTMLQRVLDARGERPAPAGLRAVLLGGAAAPAALLERAAKLGFPVLPTYGLTEAASQVATLPLGAPLRPDGGGLRPLLGTEIRIVDHAGAVLPVGEAGEIVVRGRTVMSGYHDLPEETARVLAGGWLRTGDIGVLDGGGALRVIDRRDDLVVSGGENVYPAEVEAALLAHPEVSDVGVAGLPDADLGQRVAAWVALRPGARADAAELERFVRARLAGFKVPRVFRFVEALPRNAAGKLSRRELADVEGGNGGAPRPERE